MLIGVFCLIIVRVLSQDRASHFFLIKVWQKSRLAYAAISACKFRNKTNSLRSDKVLLLRNLRHYDLRSRCLGLLLSNYKIQFFAVHFSFALPFPNCHAELVEASY